MVSFLSQILLAPFLNTLTHKKVTTIVIVLRLPLVFWLYRAMIAFNILPLLGKISVLQTSHFPPPPLKRLHKTLPHWQLYRIIEL